MIEKLLARFGYVPDGAQEADYLQEKLLAAQADVKEALAAVRDAQDMLAKVRLESKEAQAAHAGCPTGDELDAVRAHRLAVMRDRAGAYL